LKFYDKGRKIFPPFTILKGYANRLIEWSPLNKFEKLTFFKIKIEQLMSLLNKFDRCIEQFLYLVNSLKNYQL